jgi:hypothetical protein
MMFTIKAMMIALATLMVGGVSVYFLNMEQEVTEIKKEVRQLRMLQSEQMREEEKQIREAHDELARMRGEKPK